MTAGLDEQEGGCYRHYCYLPLYVFCGEHLLCARLRPADTTPRLRPQDM